MPSQYGDVNLLTTNIPVDRHRIEDQNRILELITPGTFLDEALDSLVKSIELQSPTGMRGSILLLDADGKHLRHGAAPSLPDIYTAAIDGTVIGPAAGSCGTAAFTGETVIVSDISTDPLWADYRHLALEHGLQACWSTPIFSGTGEILGTFAMYYDQPGSPSEEDRQLITFAARTAALLIERKRADEVQARLAAIVESSDDAIVSKDLNGIIMTWNAGAEQLFGYTAGEAVGQPITILIPTDRLDEEPEILRRIRRGDRVDHFETVRRRKNGALVDISLTVSPVMDSYGRVVGASKIARDITERRMLERQKDAFIGIAAHELRTPVTGIKAYTQLLARRMRKTNDTAALATLGKLEAQVDRLTGLISDMLDVTRMDGSDLPFRPAPFELNQLLTEVIDETRQTTQHQIVADLAAPVTLVGDRDRIAQVVTNLLTNAIKYSPNADRVVVRTARHDAHVTIAVQDFGIGIPKEDQPHIFDRFYRVTTNGRDGYAGLGLGLYIAAEFVKRHNGTIWVESNPGQGTTIAFSLPLDEPRNSPDAGIV